MLSTYTKNMGIIRFSYYFDIRETKPVLLIVPKFSRLAPCLVGIAMLASGVPSRAQEPAPTSTPDLPLNRYQFIGTHNSYHVAPSAKILQMIDVFADGQGKALDYTHRPIREQLEVLKVRQIELDLFGDPEGGRYANPLAAQLAGQTPHPLDPAWKEPGFKVFHSPDFDQGTTVISLRTALKELRIWSDASPEHEPVLVLLELGTESYSATKPPPIDRDALLKLEAEIREGLPEAKILMPDQVRGEFATLREAVIHKGWPLLSQLRGKFLFALDNEGSVRDTYLDLSPNKDLKGRICFVSVPPEHAAAGWMKCNDAIQDFQRIQSLVKAGFVVRTRADADMQEVLVNDRKRLDAALASGAQWISTDAPEPVPSQPLYSVSFPNRAPLRLNLLLP